MMDDPGWKVLKWVTICVGVCFLCLCLIPILDRHPDAAPNSSCKNNLKVIGLAMHEYHEVYGSFPPMHLADENGQPMHSWRVLLLPFLDHWELYDQYRFEEPWDSPHNSALADEIGNIYRCPGYARDCGELGIHSQHLTNYIIVPHPDGVFDGTRATSLKEITDDSSETILVMEVRHHGTPWMQPEHVTFEAVLRDLKFAQQKKASNHYSILNVLMADGSVRAMTAETVDEEWLRKRITRNGGEDVDD